MNRKELLKKLEAKLECKICIIENEDKETLIKNFGYEVIEDILIIKEGKDKTVLSINLNDLREIKEEENLITIILDDKAETVIKIQL